MIVDLTPIARAFFKRQACLTNYPAGSVKEMQTAELLRLLRKAANTDVGQRFSFGKILSAAYPAGAFAETVPVVEYEDIRADIMRMLRGEKNIAWPGRVSSFAQSSGTSGGKSKFIPITDDGLRINHYRGASDVVANYLRLCPQSRIFAGKSMILGGSFANTLEENVKGVKVGDLSATLIDRMNGLANLFRIPDKTTALLSDWNKKLPALVESALKADVTNISGVPSWYLTVLRKIIEQSGADTIHDIWPNLEVFFHGGISFEPYREEYSRITNPDKMHYLETYNASEGFFAVQNDFECRSMLLLINAGVYYEFMEAGASLPVSAWELEKGKVYELIISSANGLWRYRIGDTVIVDSTDPVKIRIAGRTKTYMNAFGEELMEHNAERGITEACKVTGASIRNYTAAPVYAENGKRGRHQWFIEWILPPKDISEFSATLDAALCEINSDYEAKRSGSIFLDAPEVVTMPEGAFDRWLEATGSGKLGGQRKVPRLSNDRRIADQLMSML